MDTKPLVTVVVPSYNSPDLQAALLSVLNQDYPHIQLILVDDGSASFSKTDVESFIQAYSHPNLEYMMVLSNSENIGTVRTLNRGLALAKGEIIFTLAGDDCFFDNHVLTDWVAAFRESGAQIMTAYRAAYDEKLEKFLYTAPTKTEVWTIKNLPPEKLFEVLAERNYIFGCCTARTAQSVQRYGAFDERYYLVEDHPMNLRLLRQHEKICFFDRVVVKHRSNGSSSPLRYTPVYAQDVDKILQYDVLPFTKHPRRMRWKYWLWKRDQKLLHRRAQLFAKYESGAMRLMIQLWYYLHHPWRTLCRVPQWIRKKMKGM